MKCSSQNIVKNGTQGGVQRYQCKDCHSVFRGKKPKYSAEFKLEAVMMYLNSMSIRGIGRIKKVHNSVISTWIKKMGTVAKESFSEKLKDVQPQNISILEVDELFTYVKKKRTGSMFLLLSTEMGSELLIIK